MLNVCIVCTVIVMRKQVVFDEATLQVIQEYRKHQNPIPNFSQAVRDLIKLARGSDSWTLMEAKTENDD